MKNSRTTSRAKRHRRVRSSIKGTAERPRLAVHKSLRNLQVQLIDDVAHKTLAEASTLTSKSVSNMVLAETIGKTIAEAALKLNIKEVVFDRGGYIYHGQIKALAEAARAVGLKF